MSIPRVAVLLPIGLLLAACGRDDHPSLIATEMTAYAAMPGQPAGVAYFSLANATGSAITLRRVTSPEYGRVEMHTTLIDDGVARMMALDSLTIAGNSGIAFAPGGPHLMLLEPVNGLDIGDVVTLQFHFDQGEAYVAAEDRQADDTGFLAVRAPLLPR